jgi:hypothetical protein
MPKDVKLAMKQTRAGLYVAADVEPTEKTAAADADHVAVEINNDANFATGVLTQTFKRGDEEPYVVVMAIADVIELAAKLTLGSVEYMRQVHAAKQQSGG